MGRAAAATAADMVVVDTVAATKIAVPVTKTIKTSQVSRDTEVAKIKADSKVVNKAIKRDLKEVIRAAKLNNKAAMAVDREQQLWVADRADSANKETNPAPCLWET